VVVDDLFVRNDEVRRDLDVDVDPAPHLKGDAGRIVGPRAVPRQQVELVVAVEHAGLEIPIEIDVDGNFLIELESGFPELELHCPVRYADGLPLVFDTTRDRGPRRVVLVALQHVAPGDDGRYGHG